MPTRSALLPPPAAVPGSHSVTREGRPGAPLHLLRSHAHELHGRVAGPKATRDRTATSCRTRATDGSGSSPVTARSQSWVAVSATCTPRHPGGVLAQAAHCVDGPLRAFLTRVRGRLDAERDAERGHDAGHQFGRDVLVPEQVT